MSTPKCPHCQAGIFGSVLFWCGTYRNGSERGNSCYERELRFERAARQKAEAELAKWLKWSNGQYPDDSIGTVIEAYEDGTIVLDDGVTAWNPMRALAYKEAAHAETRKELEKWRANAINLACALRNVERHKGLLAGERAALADFDAANTPKAKETK